MRIAKGKLPDHVQAFLSKHCGTIVSCNSNNEYIRVIVHAALSAEGIKDLASIKSLTSVGTALDVSDDSRWAHGCFSFAFKCAPTK